MIYYGYAAISANRSISGNLLCLGGPISMEACLLVTITRFPTSRTRCREIPPIDHRGFGLMKSIDILSCKLWCGCFTTLANSVEPIMLCHPEPPCVPTCSTVIALLQNKLINLINMFRNFCCLVWQSCEDWGRWRCAIHGVPGCAKK